jgi:hypothetical protein
MTIKKISVYNVFLFIVLFNVNLSAKTISQRPRLILKPNRITALKSSLLTTHRQLWELALESSDEFRKRKVPKMTRAHNRYRDIGDTMPALGLTYLVTGKKKYVRAAEKWLKALLSVPEWKGSQNLGRSSWITGCALLYDWLYDALDKKLREQIKTRLLAETPIVIETASYTRALSNHLLIETTAIGMAGLALQGEADEAEVFLDQADKWAMYIINYAPLDGSWGEGVQYWQYGLGYFLRFLEACETSGYKDYYSRYEWLQKTGYFPIYFSLPDRPTEVINFSDCGSKRYIPPFQLYKIASRYDNGYFQDYGNRVFTSKPHKFSWLDFIFYNPDIDPVDIYALPTLHHFSDHGFVTMRSGWDKNATAIGFRCGPAPGHRNQKDSTRIQNRGFGPGHQHPDINSFCLFSEGKWLAIDPGYTRLKSTRNHNTIIVNGYEQAGGGKKWLDYMAFEEREPAPAILKVESNPVYDFILGDAGNIYVDEAELKYFRRHMLFIKPDIVIIADDLAAKKNSKFEWLISAIDSVYRKGPEHFELFKEGIRLYIKPILPVNYEAEIQKRKIAASDVKSETDIEEGILRTLNLQVKSVSEVRYLIVLCTLTNIYTPVPQVTFKDNRIIISHCNNSWMVLYKDKTEKPGDPLLIVEKPDVEEVYYNFVRDE